MRYKEKIIRFTSDKTLETYKSKFGQEFMDWYDPTDKLNAMLTYIDGYVYNLTDFSSLWKELEKFNDEKTIIQYDDLETLVGMYLIEYDDIVIPENVYIDHAKHAIDLIRCYERVLIDESGIILDANLDQLRECIGELFLIY